MALNLNVHYDPKSYEELESYARTIYKNHPDPTSFEAQYSMANVITETMPHISRGEALRNAPKIIEAYTGHKLDTQGAWEEFKKTWKSTAEDLKISMAYSRAMMAHGKDGSFNEALYKRRIEEAEQLISESSLTYRTDFKDMSLFTDLLTSSGRLGPSMIPTISMYVGAGIASPILGAGGFAAARGAGAIYSGLMEAGGVAKDLHQLEGPNGEKLSSEDIFSAWAITAAATTGLNLVTQRFEKMTGDLIGKIFSKESIKSFTRSGGFTSWGMNLLKNKGFNILQEGAEESVEDLIGMLATNYALNEANKDYQKDIYQLTSSKEMMSNMAKTFVETAKGMVLMGLPTEVGSAVMDYNSNSTTLKREANKYSAYDEESYAISTKDIVLPKTPASQDSSPLATPPKAVKVGNKVVISDEAEASRVKALMMQGATALNVKLSHNPTSADIDTVTSSNEALNVALNTEDAKVEDNKVVLPTMNDAKREAEKFATNSKGLADYRESPNGITVVRERDGVVTETVFTTPEFADKAANPIGPAMAKPERETELFEDIVTPSPKEVVESTFRNYSRALKQKGATKDQVNFMNDNVMKPMFEAVRNKFPNKSEAEIYETVLPSTYFAYLTARVAGMSPQEYFNKNFTPESFIALTPEQESEYIASVGGQESIAIESKLSNIPEGSVPLVGGLALQTGKDGKTTIGIGRGYTPLTVVHELGHVLVSNIQDSEIFAPFKKLYAKELEADSGRVGKVFQERFARDLEQYIKDGKTRDKSLSTVFKRIIDAIKDFIKYNNLKLDTNTRKAFDDLFDLKLNEEIRNTTPQREAIVEQAQQLDLFSDPEASADTLAQLVNKVESEPMYSSMRDIINETDLLSENNKSDRWDKGIDIAPMWMWFRKLELGFVNTKENLSKPVNERKRLTFSFGRTQISPFSVNHINTKHKKDGVYLYHVEKIFDELADPVMIIESKSTDQKHKGWPLFVTKYWTKVGNKYQPIVIPLRGSFDGNTPRVYTMYPWKPFMNGNQSIESFMEAGNVIAINEKKMQEPGIVVEETKNEFGKTVYEEKSLPSTYAQLRSIHDLQERTPDRIILDLAKEINKKDIADIKNSIESEPLASIEYTNTNTPEFKAWFGDSKVVDENGEPLVVYHGTGSVFTEFDVEQSGKNFVGLGDYGFGIYLTEDPKYANKYAMGAKGTPNIIPAYLSMQNPLIVRKGSATKELERIAPHARTERELSNYVKELGYDGIIVNDGIGDNLYVYEAVAFSPNQVKSVFNHGEWSTENDNIMASIEYAASLDTVKRQLANGEYPSDTDLEAHAGDPEVDYEIQYRRISRQDPDLIDMFRDAYDQLQKELDEGPIENETQRLLEIMDESVPEEDRIDLQETTGNPERFIERAKRELSFKSISKAINDFNKAINDNDTLLEYAKLLTANEEISESSPISPYIFRLANHANPKKYTFDQARKAMKQDAFFYHRSVLRRQGNTAQISYENAHLSDWASGQTFSTFDNSEVKKILTSNTDAQVKALIRKGFATPSVLQSVVDIAQRVIDTETKALNMSEAAIEALMKMIEQGENEYRRRNVAYLELQELNKKHRDRYNKLKVSMKRKTDALKAKQAMEKLIRQGDRMARQTGNYDAKVMEKLAGFWKVMKTSVGVKNDLTDVFKDAGINYDTLPAPLQRFFEKRDDGIYFKKKMNKMSLGELQLVKDSMKQVRDEARKDLTNRKRDMLNRLNPIVNDLYAKMYGLEGSTLMDTVQQFKEGPKRSGKLFGSNQKRSVKAEIDAKFLTFSRLLRQIDPTETLSNYFFGEGGLLDIEGKEQQAEMERYESGQIKLKQLGIKTQDLHKKLIELPRANKHGKQIITYDQGVAIYIYNQQDQGRYLLKGTDGNALSQEEIDTIINMLPENYKAWGDYMIDDMLAKFPELSDVYYKVKNKKLGYIARYFPLVSGAENKSFSDLMDEVYYNMYEKPSDSMTYKRQGGMYELSLNATQNWFRMVHQQEHYLNAAEFIRDTEFMLSENGGDLYSAIELSAGSTYAKAVKDFINRYAKRTHVYDTTDTFLNHMRSNLAVARLGFNVITAFKQIPSLMSFAVKFGPMRLMESLGQVIFNWKETQNFIYEKSPKMKNRRFSHEMELIENLNASKLHQRAIKRIGKIGMTPIQFMDKVVVNTLWLGAYNASLDKQVGAKDEAAAIREATLFIGETQPGGSVIDTAAIYNSDNPLMKFVLMFSSQLNKNFNMIWGDIPTAFKQKQYAKAMRYAIALGLSFTGILFASGEFFDDDDDESVVKKLLERGFDDLPEGMDVVLEFASQFFNQTPIIGNTLGSIINGNYYAGSDMLVLPELHSLLSAYASDDSPKKREERINKALARFGFSVTELTGLPTGMGQKLYATFSEDDVNWGALLNSKWAEILSE